MRRRLGPLILCSIALLVGSAEASTTRTVFRNVSIDQGLSDSHLKAIVQDREGFLWFATVDGLNRYDGYEIRIFGNHQGDPRSLGSNYTFSLYVDRSGRLWVGTIGGGLHRYDAAREDFVRYQHDPNDSESLAANQVYAIVEDRSGALWIGTSRGLDRMDPSSGRFRHYRHDPGDPESLSHDDVYSVIEDRNGALWIGTWGEGLAKLDPGRGSFERYDRGLASLRIVSILEDRSGRLWVGASGGGLSRFDPDTESFQTYRHDPADPDSLSNDNVVWLYQDREELLWIGTGGGGVNVLDPLRKPFDTLRFSASGDHRPASLPDVRDIHEDPRGTLWVGTLGAGLYELDEIYGWGMRRRIFVLYGELKFLETELAARSRGSRWTIWSRVWTGSKRARIKSGCRSRSRRCSTSCGPTSAPRANGSSSAAPPAPGRPDELARVRAGLLKLRCFRIVLRTLRL